MTAGNSVFHAYPADPAAADFYRDVINGLSILPRRIAPKYFYDERGAALFEEICEQPEYYPTTSECEILEDYAADIAGMTGTGSLLIEPGCGSCEKVRILLDEIRPTAYVPVDIACRQLQHSAREISNDYDWLDVHAVCADITADLELPHITSQHRCLVFYPGSSIGNFEPAAAVNFMHTLGALCGKGGHLLIGVDLEKDHHVLNAAYNDAQGITAEFNLNLLRRINRELQANFDIDAFTHHAFYNSDAARIEMHLVSTCRQTVEIGSHAFEFSTGDSIHTENSYKYTNDGFTTLARDAGYVPVGCWLDDAGLFALHLLRVAG